MVISTFRAPEPRLHVLNFGGLANRLNNVINGLYLSSVLGRRLTIIWPINSACSCRFASLFSNELDVIELDVEDPPESPEQYYELAGHDTVFFKNEWAPGIAADVRMSQFRRYADTGTGRTLFGMLTALQTDILLQGYAIFDFVSLRNIQRSFRLLSPTPLIAEAVEEFTRQHDVDRKVIGMHIRRTDAASLDDSLVIRKIHGYIKRNPKQKIFACSDSSETELQLNSLFPDNVIIRVKSSQTERRDVDGSWSRSEQTGSRKYNVFRSEDAVIQALIDFCILTKTALKVRSRSTFSQLAYYLSISNSLEGYYVEARRQVASFRHRKRHDP